ncbi:MAG: beta-propeller domain-containing protein, partial [Nitrososphaerota archaeon]|nr:beta-propeller domain-containing protein [Nitrososphaerota archaeon]
MFQKEVKHKTKLYTLAAVLSAVILVSSIYAVTSPTILYSLTGVSPMKNFASTDEMKNYLLTNTQTTQHTYSIFDTRGRDNPSAPSEIGYSIGGNVEYMPRPDAAISTTGSATDYSQTNTQVAGVDEADIVKTDGTYIYFVATIHNAPVHRTVQIVKADPKNPAVVGSITFDYRSTIAGMYLSEDGNRLAVLARTETYHTSIYVYDVSNKAEPFLTRNMTLSGVNSHSRMIGNYIYAVVSQSVYVDNDENVTLPQISVDTATYEVVPTSIYYADVKDAYFSCSTFVSLNMMDDTEQPTDLTILMGSSSCM